MVAVTGNGNSITEQRALRWQMEERGKEGKQEWQGGKQRRAPQSPGP